MNGRKARQLRRTGLSPAGTAAIRRFEAQRNTDANELRKAHRLLVARLDHQLSVELREVRDRYAQRIDAVRRGDRSGIEIATRVPT